MSKIVLRLERASCGGPRATPSVGDHTIKWFIVMQADLLFLFPDTVVGAVDQFIAAQRKLL